MLMYGSNPFVVDKDNTLVYNYASLNERLENAQLLPPNYLGAKDEYDFDIRYMHYLLDNDWVFVRMMDIIVMPLYQGKDIYLVITDIMKSGWVYTTTESLLKFLQQRYGYNGILIETNEDYIEAVRSTDTRIITPQVMSNIDTDKDRWVYLKELSKVTCTGRVEYE